MEKKKLYTLFMAVLMVGSIFSFTFFFSGDQGEGPPSGEIPIDPTITPPTVLRFEATGVTSSVEQLFPTIFLIASTTEAEISVIDQKVLEVEGVKRINNSFYRQQGTTSISSSLVYIAEIPIESAELREKIALDLQNLVFFQDTTVSVIGLVSLPQTVTLSSPELNLTQEHTFSNPASSAYLNIGTMEGDELLVSLEVTLSGRDLQNLLAVEEINLTSYPKTIQLKKDLEIIALNNYLFLKSAKILVSKTENLIDAEDKVNDLEAVESAMLDASPPNFPATEPMIVLFKEDALLYEEDLETFFSDFNGIIQSNIDLNELSAEVFFNQEIDILEFKQNLKTELDSLGFMVKEIIEPFNQVTGGIEFDSVTASELIFQIEEIFNEFEISEAEFLVSVQVKSDELVEEKTGETFIIEEGFFDTSVKSTYNVGGTVSLEVTLTVSRGKVISVSATEVKEEVVEEV